MRRGESLRLRRHLLQRACWGFLASLRHSRWQARRVNLPMRAVSPCAANRLGRPSHRLGKKRQASDQAIINAGPMSIIRYVASDLRRGSWMHPAALVARPPGMTTSVPEIVGRGSLLVGTVLKNQFRCGCPSASAGC